jgi:hypothetical protein
MLLKHNLLLLIMPFVSLVTGKDDDIVLVNVTDKSQSKRQFGTRLKEHQKAVSTLDKGKSALAEHVCYTKHVIAWENSKVITTNNRYGQRLCGAPKNYHE